MCIQSLVLNFERDPSIWTNTYRRDRVRNETNDTYNKHKSDNTRASEKNNNSNNNKKKTFLLIFCLCRSSWFAASLVCAAAVWKIHGYFLRHIGRGSVYSFVSLSWKPSSQRFDCLVNLFCLTLALVLINTFMRTPRAIFFAVRRFFSSHYIVHFSSIF